MGFIDVDLYIPEDELMKWYKSQVSWVNACARDGRRVRFPVEVIRPYVLHNGVRGTFRIFFSDEGRFIRIERL